MLPRRGQSVKSDLHTDFAGDELSSLRYMFWGRCTAFAIVAIWTSGTVALDRAWAYLSVILLFLVSGAIPYWLANIGCRSSLIVAAFLLIDAAMLSYPLIVPNPYELDGWPPQMNLRTQGLLYLGLFLAYMSLSYKPILVV